MVLHMPWRHFLWFSNIFISRKNPNISEEISNSFHDKSHWKIHQNIHGRKVLVKCENKL